MVKSEEFHPEASGQNSKFLNTQYLILNTKTSILKSKISILNGLHSKNA